MRISIRSIALCLAFAIQVSAAPSQMTYQGQITDPGGNPVPDGNYTITCRIYDVAGGGVALYNSGGIVTATSDGIFTVQLLAVDQSLFTGDTRYMGIQVGADPEIFPRTRLTTVPYAHRVETVDSASGGTITGSIALSDGSGPYVIAASGANSLSTINEIDVEVTRLWGGSWGQLLLWDNSGDQVVELNANASGGASLTMREEDGTAKLLLDAVDGNLGATQRMHRSDGLLTAYLASGDPSVAAKGGELELMNEFGLTVINLNASTTGNASVNLPDDAIWSPEMYNEPGIASGFDFLSPVVNGASTVAIDSVEIDVPTAGYLVVTASGFFSTDHVTGTDSFDRVFLSPTRAVIDFDNFAISFVEAGSATDTYYESFHIVVTDLVGAGVTKYYLNANEFTGGGDFTTRHHLVIQFYPTSYGTVIETAPPPFETLTTHSASGVGTWKSNIRTITIEEHKAMVAAEVAKIRSELEATSARLQKLEEQQQQIQNDEN